MKRLTDNSFLSLRTPVVKTGQIKRWQGLEKLGDMWWLCATPHNVFFLSIAFKKTMVLFQNDIWLCENT